MEKSDFYNLVQVELDSISPPQLLKATDVTDLPKGNIVRVGKSEFYQDNKFVCKGFNKHISRMINFYEI